MKRYSFGAAFALFWIGLIFCGGARVWLKLRHMDHATGFYMGGGALPVAFNAVLTLCVVLLFLLYLLRRPFGDYPILRDGRGIALAAVLLGVSMLLYGLETLGLLPFGDGNPVRLHTIATIICGALSLASSVAMLVTGLQGIFTGKLRGGLLPLLPGIWLLVLLVCRFNAYDTLTTISDSLMTVMFYLFGAVFLVGHARTLNGFARKDGRNYVIPAGLSASLFGLLAVLPNWIWMAVNKTLTIPALLMGQAESVFIFVMSVYAFAFVRHTCASIRQV